MSRLWVTAVFRRDTLLLKDAPWGMALSLASTVLGVLLFGLLGRFVGTGTSYVTLVLTGITFLRVIDAIVHAPGQGVREERSRGSLEVLLDAPRAPWALVLSAGVVPALRSVIEGCIALIVAAQLFNTGIHPGWRGVIAIPAAVVCITLLALSTGLFLAAAGMRSRAATAASTFFGLMVAMTSGVYYPRRALPTWLQSVSDASPYTFALRSLRAALTRGPGLLAECLVSIGAAALLFGAGALIMARAVTRARLSGAFARG